MHMLSWIQPPGILWPSKLCKQAIQALQRKEDGHAGVKIRKNTCLETLHKAYKGQISRTERKCFRNPRNSSNDRATSPWISRSALILRVGQLDMSTLSQLCFALSKAISTFLWTAWKNINCYLIFTTRMSVLILFSSPVRRWFCGGANPCACLKSAWKGRWQLS